MFVLNCIPRILAESPVLLTAGRRACLHKVCFLLCSRGKKHFLPPVSVSLWRLRERGNFTTAPSHRQPNPTSLDSPGMRVMAPAWLWLRIFTVAPARAHFPRGPTARLGHGLMPGSMKTSVVHRSTGASRIHMG